MTIPFVKTELGADPIIVNGYFAASPQQVFRAWTDPDLIVEWFGPKPGSLFSVDVDLRVGGAWRFVKTNHGTETTGFEGVYLDIRPHSLLIFSWSKFATNSELGDSRPVSRVEIVLSERGSGTDISITHSAIADHETRIGFAGGWEHGMKNMQKLFLDAPYT